MSRGPERRGPLRGGPSRHTRGFQGLLAVTMPLARQLLFLVIGEVPHDRLCSVRLPSPGPGAGPSSLMPCSLISMHRFNHRITPPRTKPRACHLLSLRAHGSFACTVFNLSSKAGAVASIYDEDPEDPRAVLP